MISFVWPWLLLLLPLPLLARRLLPPQRSAQAAIWLPLPPTLLNQLQTPDANGHRSRLWLLWLVWLLLILSAARPVWLGEPVPQQRQGKDLMLAIDLSQSMTIRDMVGGNRYVDRITAVKAVVSEFIERRAGDRLGLVLFADNAYLQAPLTYDLATVNQMLHESVVGLVGERTAIGEAIGLALKRLQQSETDKVLILLTDGQNTAGAVMPLDAATLAAEHDLRIYTIGVGSQRSRDLDEHTLKAIAAKTGGSYFRAADAQQLAGIYAQIDQLESHTQELPMLRPRREWYYWPLAAALLLVFTQLILTEMRTRLLGRAS